MAYLIMWFAVLARFAPGIPNFSPVFGALLFSGAHLKKRDFIWFPVALLAASDVVLTTEVYHMRLRWSQAVVWVAFAAIAAIGRWLGRRISLTKFIATALAGPTAFFLISNLGVWLGSRMYPGTWDGLAACYVAALPFYRNSLLSSLLFGSILFGAYEFYKRRSHKSELRSSTVHAG